MLYDMLIWSRQFNYNVTEIIKMYLNNADIISKIQNYYLLFFTNIYFEKRGNDVYYVFHVNFDLEKPMLHFMKLITLISPREILNTRQYKQQTNYVYVHAQYDVKLHISH